MMGVSYTNRAIVGEPAPRFTCKAIIEGRIRGEISVLKQALDCPTLSNTAQNWTAAPS